MKTLIEQIENEAKINLNINLEFYIVDDCYSVTGYLMVNGDAVHSVGSRFEDETLVDKEELKEQCRRDLLSYFFLQGFVKHIELFNLI